MAQAPASDEIRACLDRILASGAFLRAEKQSAFLRFIVERHLAGESIRETDIGVSAYRRQADYDPREDPIVRVEASRLRSRLRDYYTTDGKNDPIRIDLPKGAYVPEIQFASAATAAALPEAPPPKKRWLAIGAVALLAGSLGYWQFVHKPAAARDRRAAANRTFRQASALHMQMTPAAVREARLLHEAVVRMDPTWPTAHSGLSHTYISLISVGGATRDELGPAALEAAQRSLRLDPLLADGHAALIRYHRDVRMDFPMVEAACRTALEKTPGVPQILINCAPVQSILGHHEIAELWAREAVRVDPTWGETWYTQALVLWRAGRSADAKAPARKAIEIDSKTIGARAILALIAVEENQPDEAMRLMEWGLPAAGIDREEWYAYRGHVAARLGRAEEARKMLERLDQRARTHVVSPVSFARIRLAERNTEAALTLIEEAVRRRDVEVAYFLTSPEAEPVKDNPRYRAAARALNLNPIP